MTGPIGWLLCALRGGDAGAGSKDARSSDKYPSKPVPEPWHIRTDTIGTKGKRTEDTMNWTKLTLWTLLLAGIVWTGSAVAGTVVDPSDYAFITAGPSQAAAVSPATSAWSSAGVVGQADYDRVTRGNGTVIRAEAPVPEPTVTVAGRDYALIAGDGSPGATCSIALVAMISGACTSPA